MKDKQVMMTMMTKEKEQDEYGGEGVNWEEYEVGEEED